MRGRYFKVLSINQIKFLLAYWPIVLIKTRLAKTFLKAILAITSDPLNWFISDMHIGSAGVSLGLIFNPSFSLECFGALYVKVLKLACSFFTV